MDGNGNVTKRFIYGTHVNSPELVRFSNGITCRIVHDQIGSPIRCLSVNDGTELMRREYDEFGRDILNTNPELLPIGFAGGLEDRDTGLVRFGAREYDPETGRWLAPDPIRFRSGSYNLYQYNVGDPINFIDPFGLYEWGYPANGSLTNESDQPATVIIGEVPSTLGPGQATPDTRQDNVDADYFFYNGDLYRISGGRNARIDENGNVENATRIDGPHYGTLDGLRVFFGGEGFDLTEHYLDIIGNFCANPNQASAPPSQCPAR